MPRQDKFNINIITMELNKECDANIKSDIYITIIPKIIAIKVFFKNCPYLIRYTICSFRRIYIWANNHIKQHAHSMVIITHVVGVLYFTNYIVLFNNLTATICPCSFRTGLSAGPVPGINTSGLFLTALPTIAETIK